MANRDIGVTVTINGRKVESLRDELTQEERLTIADMISAAALGYDGAIDDVMKALEGIARVKTPASEYLAALERTRDKVESWIEASIDAARDDVKREAGE